MNTRERLESQFKSKRFGRREVLIGGCAVTAAALLPTNDARAQAKSGGHLILGIGGGGSTNSFDPSTTDDTFMITANFTVRDNLTEIGSDNKLHPALAEEWEASPDAKTWTFKLRKGVEFHNGKTLDADDVVNTINIHRGKDSKSGAKGVVAGIESVRADGKNTVVFELTIGSADFPYLLTDYHLQIMPTIKGKTEWRSGIGTGCYVLKDFDPGVRASFRRNENRWQEDQGHVDTAELLLINDINARQTSLMTGTIHAINRVDLKTVHFLKDAPGINVIDVPGKKHQVLPMDTRQAPFDNNDVRLALKYSLDRDEWLEKVLRGHGVKGNDHPIGPAYRYHASDIPQRDYDPDRARFHLKKAGLSELNVNLSASQALFPGAVDGPILFQEHARKVGININVVREPDDGYWDDVWMKKPWCVAYWGPRAVEDMLLSLAYLSTSSWNDSHLNNPKLDTLILEARAELDEVKRSEMYREIQMIIRDEGGTIVAAHSNLIHGLSKKVGNKGFGTSWEMDGGYAVKRWWLV